ncbi:MAG: hypothetical protein HKM89_10480 [Gemmatimonadales bacterium]|nr:hypothetical protein [Gemmatimonadales bacterium]
MKARAAVMLSDSDEGKSVARGLARRSCPVMCYNRLEDLVREQPLGSIPVLIFHLRQPPKGVLLGVIGRLALEFPAMQKVAIAETPLSLLVTEYLTACKVDLIWTEPKGQDLDALASVVDRMHERWNRCLTVC